MLNNEQSKTFQVGEVSNALVGILISSLYFIKVL